MLLITCGLPGAGKSTFVTKKAAEMGAVVICPDKIRKEITGDEADQSRNAEVFELAYKRLDSALSAGKDVIFDATNTTKRARASLISYARKYDAESKAVYFNIPLATCLARNSKRVRKVPEDVIHRMFKHLERPSKKEGFTSLMTVVPAA